MPSNSMQAKPLAINHVGLSVPRLDEAVRWYSEVMGFRLISGPHEITADQPRGPQVQNVLGADFRGMRMAHLSAGNGVGLELFEIVDPPHQPSSGKIEYNRGGFFHICVTDPDVAGLASRIVDAGGRQLSKIWPERDQERQEMVYCSDPFGNVIEVYSCSYDLMQGWR